MYTLELNSYPLDEEKIGMYLDLFSKELSLKGDYSVSFVSDDEIRELNFEYRGKNECTDILTFAFADTDPFPNPEGSVELGDIFISLASMKRNAEAFGVSEDEELRRLLLHGLLHLMGYDHKSNDFEKEEMLIKQEEILSRLK